jgi:hypothetical protein
MTKLAIPFLTAAVLMGASPFQVRATVNWDDLPQGSYQPTPLGYGGYNWFFGDSTFGSTGPNDGNHGLLQYSTAANEGVVAHSPPNAAYNAWGFTPMRIESLDPGAGSEFTLSGWFSSQGDLGVGGAFEVQAQGFIGTSSTPAFTTIFTLPLDGTWVNESFATDPAVNKLLLTPLDNSGTAYAPNYPAPGYFWMDDVQLTTSAVPETSTIITGALMLLPFGAGAARQLRKKLQAA